MHLDSDFVRGLNAAIALAGVFAVALGLSAGWHKLPMRWVLVAYVTIHLIAALSYWAAINDPNTSHGDAPARLLWQTFGLLAVFGTACYAAYCMRRGPKEPSPLSPPAH